MQVSLGGITASTTAVVTNGTAGQYGWQSHPGGIVDPAAQNVSFDVMVLPAAVRSEERRVGKVSDYV